ncbi:TonB-dependent receptor [Sulfuricurvum sp. RIFCSPLOWO2_12_FULL_43_24]|uniref:TonB-dependent receptor plug domain-containing protein n=1 Tax=Sulfuricurvum sp. RIFCSPLOWO2_12_FULL_43_24 TaxID=1802247 RepID=UPI000B3359BA|nr:TonB-dependent receptor [Sulfuricurvum sp. RIFCSPLOWO2_12_FULL_43_24]
MTKRTFFFRRVLAGFFVGVSVPFLVSPVQGAQAPELLAQNDLLQMSIEDLTNLEVTTASKFSQKIAEAPASVTVITEDEIKIYGYRNLADILSGVRGLYTTNDRNYEYAGVRGFNRPGDYNSRILLLVDGTRINDADYDTASIGQEFFLDIDLIKRIEIIRGPGSSIYGSNAFFGVINIITKSGSDYKGGELSASIGSFGTTGARGTYAQVLQNGTDVLLSASYDESRGQNFFFPEFNDPSTNNGMAQDLDSDRAKRFYGKVSFGELTMSAGYSERVKKVPTASFESIFNDPRTQTTDSEGIVSLAYTKALSDKLELSGKVFAGGYYYKGTFPYDQPPVTINQDDAFSEWAGAEAKALLRLEGHTIIVGGEYQKNLHQNMKNYDEDPAALYNDLKMSSDRKALYFQDEITLSERLILNAGIRYDAFSTVGETINPRLALIYALQPETVLKLLYGSAFRAPNTYEMYSSGFSTKANHALQPEEIKTYEAIIEHHPQNNLRLSASLYRNDINNLINQVIDPSDGFSVFQNIGQVQTIGAEVEAEKVWSNQNRLRVSYTWQKTIDQITNQELENSPRNLAALQYAIPLFDEALQSGIRLQYVGSRKTLGGSRVGGYTLAHANFLTHELAKGTEFAVGVYNLFDHRYADPGRPEHQEDTITQDGRSVRVKLTYRF